MEERVLKDKVLLITGGTGSFGESLIKEALNFSPRAIRIFSNDEYGLWDAQRHIQDDRLRFMMGDVRDKDRLDQLMNNVDIVIHVAAMKHVDIAEYNPTEVIKTNIIGSMNVVETAISHKVERVIGISSDKAVHPINIYGATKLVMEKLFVDANNYTQTKFSCIRFGNFWGSRGSVIEKWISEKDTGTITITDKDMSRFWITLEEAIKFTLNKLMTMNGGEIFIPIMPSHTLEEIASTFAPECKMKIIGKRRGEKKNELLVAEGEEKNLVRQDDCLIIKP